MATPTLAPHLSWPEALRSSGVVGPGGLPPDVRANIERMAREMWTPLREAWGHPLVVVSGYRSPAVNAAVKGRPKSQHLQGLALDLVPASGRDDCGRLYDVANIMQRAGEIPWGGLCLYVRPDSAFRFVHVDCRPKPLKARRMPRWKFRDPLDGRWYSERPQLPDVT